MKAFIFFHKKKSVLDIKVFLRIDDAMFLLEHIKTQISADILSFNITGQWLSF